jgi:Kef-type K+ transport system membrane component KefB
MHNDANELIRHVLLLLIIIFVAGTLFGKLGTTAYAARRLGIEERSRLS